MEANNLLSLLLKSGAIMAVVWIFWFIFLNKINRFSMVRFFIIGGIILAAALPLLIPAFQAKPISLAQNALGVEFSYSIPAVVFNPIDYSSNWIVILKNIYLICCALFFVRLIIQVFKITNLIIEGKKKVTGNLTIVEHNRDISPFSFLSYCFINSSQIPANKLDGVLAHERAHYEKLHTADILIFEIIGVFHWFNPFYWLLRKTIVEIHEYEADSEAIRSKTDPQAYLDAIVSLAFNGIALPMGNNFNKSLTLKRLAMINITKKSKGAFLKLILVLAISLPVFFIISCESLVNPTLNDELIAVEDKTTPLETIEHDGEVFVMVEEMPRFNGGDVSEFRNFIAQNLTYPEDAAQKGIEGRVFVNFIVEVDGTVTNVKVERGVDPSLDNEAVRVVESSPRWTPGKQRGVEVRTTFTFPITFRLNN